ncbi:glycosyltransferase family 2 protein [Tessaracoccus sp. Y1736]
MSPQIGVVLLSMGNRPEELARSLAALERQTGVDMDVLLVGNGWVPEGVPSWVRTHHSPENIGCPAGRNLGASLVDGEYILFYDDDGELASPDVVQRMAAVLEAQPDVAVVQPRGVDPTGRPSPRRWSPWLRPSAAARGGDAVVFWEAMAMIRRSAFEEAGGWAGEFFFGHEGVDLAMRLLDRGWRIRYEPTLVVYHPATPPSRHGHFFFTTARNRAWVARRNLPALLIPLYLGVWAAATVVRVRRVEFLKVWLRGLRDGLTSELPGERHPISWGTVWHMTRLGRPPLW